MATAPAPRAYHVSWAFGDDIYVHGGEGPTGVRTETGDPDLDGVFGSVGRDLFAEEDGGAPLDPGRVVRGAGAGKGAAASGHRVRNTGPSCGTERRPPVSVLEDLWKLDSRTLRWERVRVWVSHISCLYQMVPVGSGEGRGTTSIDASLLYWPRGDPSASFDSTPPILSYQCRNLNAPTPYSTRFTLLVPHAPC